ncbi:MAG TPA: carboxy terminal-processing peptidase [Chitinophagaceae bacterium]|nr:carboxy terminal-processing peptidase [Chitinophagaceae bacterium]
MMNKRNLPVMLLVLAAGIFLAFRTLGFGSEPTPTKYEKILRNVGVMLSEIHYSPKKVDDKFSKDIFKRYLNELDQEKGMLLHSDVEALRKYETKIDDEINGSSIQFFPAVMEVYKKRLTEAEQIYKEILSKPFDFTKDEVANLDFEKREFPKTEAERKENWRKRLKYMVLERYSDLLDGQEKAKGKEGYVAKTNEQLEKEARDRAMKLMDRYFDRLKLKMTDDDRFNIFVNVITETMDPHTTFFPPVEKRYFDEQMSGRFFGIGASLKDEDGQIKIATLLTGSPAWKSGEITVNDAILKVGEGNKEPVDLTGYLVEDAVKLIRGKKGTEVKLTLKKTDGSIKVVSLIRDEIVQDETFARSAIVKEGNAKIGYIFLPEFYADFDNPKGNRSYIDVAKEVVKLKEEKVDGIIIDLRNNGGGSLYDVVQMAGLFIEEGPIVQVKDRDGKPQILRDKDKSVLYDGPLAVMVNELSASASEIFAAAIQDYKRGVVIGSTSTYGKGTVQRNIGLDKLFGMMESNTELGTIKLTLQKFYRINGGSTQLKGVTSDIVVPDVFEYSKIREKDNPDALPWDEIRKADYTPWKDYGEVDAARRRSEERIKSSAAFNMIKTNAEWLAKQNDRQYSLQLEKYRQEQKAIRQAVRQIDSLNKLQQEMVVETPTQDADKFANDTAKSERYKNWLKNLRTDIYLDEAVKVMNDMINKINLVKNSK